MSKQTKTPLSPELEKKLAEKMHKFITYSYEGKLLSHADVILGLCEMLQDADIIASHNIS